MTRALFRLVLASCLVLAGCGHADTARPALQYLGQMRVWPGATLDGTVIGGLSGISYDPGSRRYYIISDDRSAKNPARFYIARITLSDKGISDVKFGATHPWLDTDQRPFAPLDAKATPPVVPPDPEGIAVDPHRHRLYWSSEGERRTDGKPLLRDPWVRIADLDGRYLGEFRLPPGLRMSAANTGPRRNAGLEGLTLTPGGRYAVAAMEGSGYDDGELPTADHGALTRFTRFDTESRSATAQFAYPLDPVSSGPNGGNGVSDLVALNDDDFLVLERGFGTRVSLRVYRASAAGADDVLARPTVAGARPMTKTLLADLTTTPGLTPLDNIEGITLGPKLPDGRQSVVMVSDDNFSPTQITQFLAFAL